MIAYLTHRFPFATETFTYDEVRALHAAGHALTVFSFRPGERLDWPDAGPTVRTLPARPWPYLLAVVTWAARRPVRLLRCAAWVVAGPFAGRPTLRERRANLLALPRGAVLAREAGITLYHAQFANETATAALVASELSGRPFSFRTHTEPRPQLLGAKLRRAAIVLAISEDDARRLRSVEPAARVEVAPLGIPLPADAPREREPGLVVSVGSLIEKKGHDVLVEAVAALRREGRDVRLEVAGRGPLESALRRQAAAAGLDDLVFHGHLNREETLGLVARAQVFALASKPSAVGTDGVPVALIEALALRTPVVSTQLAGIPELVRDGETGLLVASGDEHALAAAIARLLDDDALAERLSLAGRMLVETERDAARCYPRVGAVLDAAANPA